MTQKTRSWVFTAWVQPNPNLAKVRYAAWGVEHCPKTGSQHYQGMVELYHAVKLDTVKERLGTGVGTYVARREGSFEQARAYCQKEGNFFEVGEPLAQGARNDLLAAKSLIDDGVPLSVVASECFPSFVRYSRGLLLYAETRQPRRTWKSTVILLYGTAGQGKTRLAHDLGGEIISYANGFILGYTHQDVVIFDDIEAHDIPRSLLLKLLDRYPFHVNIKGGATEWNPKVIIITSNYCAGFLSDEALARRITLCLEICVAQK